MGGGRLSGRRVVVTRPRDRAASLVAALEAESAEVLVFPGIEVVGPEDPHALDAARARLTEYDWLVFTSVYAVRAIGSAGQWDRGSLPRVGCVGAATAAAAAERGWAVERVPEVGTGRALADALIAGGLKAGERVLFPKAADALDALPEALRGHGARVDEVVAYRKDVPEGETGELGALLRRGAVDALTFTSPSTVEGFLLRFPGEALRAPAVVIGPTTAEAAREAGLTVLGVAADPSVEGLVHEVLRIFQE